VRDALATWSRSQRRFASWAAMVSALGELKNAADEQQLALENAVEVRAELRSIIHEQGLLPASMPTHPGDIDGLRLLARVEKLRALFIDLGQRGLTFVSVEHLARTLQQELTRKPKPFLHRADKEEEASEAGAEEAQDSAADTLAQPLGGRAFILSAPLLSEDPAAALLEPPSNWDDSESSARGVAAAKAKAGADSSLLEVYGEEADEESEPLPPVQQQQVHGRKKSSGAAASGAGVTHTLFTPSAVAASIASGSGISAAGANAKCLAQFAAEQKKQQLMQQLQELAEAQPGVDSLADDGADPSEADCITRRFDLFYALSWPACRLLSSPLLSGEAANGTGGGAGVLPSLQLTDDDLDELLAAAAVGRSLAETEEANSSDAPPSALSLALTIVRQLDAEGRRFTDVPALVEAVATRAQRRALQDYLRHFGHLLSALLRSDRLASNAHLFDKLLSLMPHHAAAAAGEIAGRAVDPMLSVVHLLARTQLHFEALQSAAAAREAAQARGGPLSRSMSGSDQPGQGRPGAPAGASFRVTEQSFLASFAHLAQASRRGTLSSLLRHGLPPCFELLFVSALASRPDVLKSQLTELRLEALLAVCGGSLYRTVRLLKEMEAAGTLFGSLQELVDAAAAIVRKKRLLQASLRWEQGKTLSDAAAATSLATLDQANGADASVPVDPSSSSPSASSASLSEGLDALEVEPVDPVLLQKRQALVQALSPPASLVFTLPGASRPAQPRFTDVQLDQIFDICGSTQKVVALLQVMERDGERVATFEHLLLALSERRQFDLASSLWATVAERSRECEADSSGEKARAYDTNKRAWRAFVPLASGGGDAFNHALFESLLYDGTGCVDPSLPVHLVLASLQRIAGARNMPSPLFQSLDELVLAVRAEAPVARRRLLCMQLFDPRTRRQGGSGLRGLFVPPLLHSSEEALVASKRGDLLCRFEGLSVSEADALLAASDHSLFLCLRHLQTLRHAGMTFTNARALLEAVVNTHQRMRAEEAELLLGAGAGGAALNSSALAIARMAAAADNTGTSDCVSSGNKLLYSASSVGGASLAEFLTPFVSDDIATAASTTDELKDAELAAENEAWRTVGGTVDERMPAFRSVLQSTELFSEWNGAAATGGMAASSGSGASLFATSSAMEAVMRVVRGDLPTLRTAITELERLHQRYNLPAAGTSGVSGLLTGSSGPDAVLKAFLADLSAWMARRDALDLLSALSYPACGLFAEVPEPGVEVDVRSLRALMHAAGGSLGRAKRMLAALDQAGVRCTGTGAAPMQGLVLAVRMLRKEQQALAQHPPAQLR